ncbi:MAG: uracil phosphoribosyltransferase [Erysipelotrichaceae bacterium]|nr:uracil phosphoribosyltransferase [Erysipelotrichaceae bacterium]
MLTVFNHPLITHKLALMRDKSTSTKDFAQQLNEIASLMAFEISRDLPTRPKHVETPMGPCETTELAKDVVLVPILRAGLGMVDGIRDLIPTAKVGFIGLFRHHDTLQPEEYFAKFPDMSEASVMVLDPMLATGGSASAAITKIKERGAKNIKLVCLVGVPEGVKRIETDHPDVDIYLAALDEKLNEIGYIVPGLGDAGDRIFGTK